MSQHLLGAWLLVLLLAAGGWTARFVPQGERCRTRETARKPPCPVMRKWMSLVRNVDEGINTSHDETILEKPQVLDKHKTAPEYGCILKQVFQFYTKVLNVGQRKGRNFTDLSYVLVRLKQCLLKVHCPGLCKKINSQAKKRKMKVGDVSDLSAGDLAVYQIQKLQRAKKRLSKDAKTLEKAIVEIKGLHNYSGNKDVAVRTCAAADP